MISRRLLTNRKGITPIISVVLLLMMTIAIAGLAFTWLQRMEATIESGTEEAAEDLFTGLRTKLGIEGYQAKCYAGTSNVEMSFFIRNSGTKTATNLLMYADDNLLNVTNYTSLSAGNTTSFVLGNRSCSDWINETRKIKVTSDQVTSETLFEITCSSGSC